LFLVDIAVPRNVEPGVNDLDNVFCYDVDDLQAVVESNLRERQREARAAETLVEREVERFGLSRSDLEVVPTIVSLREKLEGIRRAEVERALRALPRADAETRRVIEVMSQAIVNKVLHAPTAKLRDSGRAGTGRRVAELIVDLFGLSAKKPDGRPGGGA
jgi:glutamyl-tRNA reductase